MLRYFFFINRILKKKFYTFYNCIKFKANGANIGRNFRVYNKTYVLLHKGSKVEIGDNFHMTSGDFFNPLSRNVGGGIYASGNAEIKIGKNVGMSSVCIWVVNNLEVGDYVKIGADVIIMDNDAHNLDYTKRRNSGEDIAKSAPIRIGDDVLIGTKSIILKGVTIGSRSIIGAGSVVTKSIPPNCIAAGNPCKVVRKYEILNNNNMLQ